MCGLLFDAETGTGLYVKLMVQEALAQVLNGLNACAIDINHH